MSAAVVWVQDARRSEDRLPRYRRVKGEEEEKTYAVEKGNGSQKFALVERMVGGHKLDTRNSGEDDRWRRSKLPRTMDQRSPKVFLMERHDRGFPWSRTTHQRKEGGVAEELQRKPKKTGMCVDTSGGIDVSK